MVGLPEIQDARRRIAPHVRRTPLMRGAALRNIPSGDLTLKLESLQVTGSFKARGATNKVLSLAPEEAEKGLVTASGGNHGLGVAYAGWLAKLPVTIFLPSNVPPAKVARFESWGAKVVREGSVWDEADRAARERAGQEGLVYVHAFSDPAVVAGQGTIGLEILEDAPETRTVLVAIGGGGLISGVATAVKALAPGIRPGIRVVGVEPVGAPTLYESVKAGSLVELERITTAANTLAPRKSAELNLRIIQEKVDEIVLVTDEEMKEAARWLWLELGVAAELSGAASAAAWLSGKVRVGEGESVCALICGAGTEGVG
ncbi:MAG TPA: threonine/serine dehydratase [Thermoanaerobaculia bacterium]|nr:threonine/serine dehydratase [Thermoanaerobaculia bacterium]